MVVATHADDALKLIGSSASSEMLSCLARDKYQDCVCIAHTFPGILPKDVNIWKTYNIIIQNRDVCYKPYTITYVCNRHQNDRINPAYNVINSPQFFVTANPQVQIPSRYILTDSLSQKPAITNMRHNVFNFECLEVQKEIDTLQGQNCLYFAGGWTRGAGLHEECWVQGQEIATMIIAGTNRSSNWAA